MGQNEIKETVKERVLLEAELPERNFDHKCFPQHVWRPAMVTQPRVCHVESVGHKQVIPQTPHSTFSRPQGLI